MESAVIAHADEFETSLYLHLAPERVQMDKAGADDDVMGAYLSSDSTSPYVRFNDYWSRWTDLGVHGDARPATAEKGEVIFETAVTRLVELADELRQWPLAERRDFHETTGAEPHPLVAGRDVAWRGTFQPGLEAAAVARLAGPFTKTPE